jgi:hypothetical protein
MGLRTPYINYIDESIEQVFGSAKNLRMLELGDQLINDRAIREKSGKAYYENRGFEHVSVDLNGNNGALVRDLRKPEQFEDWVNSWDVITNSGTTEHVEPMDTQYECFQILHDCLKVGGIAVHLNPDAEHRDTDGMWRNHCRIYYTKPFYETLAKECEYELLSNKVIRGLRCAVVRKTKERPFMHDRAIFLEHIAEREMIPQPISIFKRIKRRIRGEIDQT